MGILNQWERDWATGRSNEMKSPEVQNIVVDEANEVTYEVTAHRQLTDGEVYSAIRVALLRRGGKRPNKGETLKIKTTRWD